MPIPVVLRVIHPVALSRATIPQASLPQRPQVQQTNREETGEEFTAWTRCDTNDLETTDCEGCVAVAWSSIGRRPCHWGRWAFLRLHVQQ